MSITTPSTLTLCRTLLLRLKTTFKWEQMNHPPYSPDLVPSDFLLFQHINKFLGGKRFDDDNLIDAVQKWLTSHAATFYEEDTQNLCPATISASIMAANMWENSLKNVESDNNKIVYETVFVIFTAKRYLLSE